MNNPYHIVAVRFREDHRAGQDIINALDMADFPAEVEDIKHLLQAAEGHLQQYAEAHDNKSAGRLAQIIRHYTQP